MINIKNVSDCCGCTACASICTHNAISMEPDVLGFLYPKVDRTKCVECGLCENVCQFNDNYDRSLNFPQPVAYAARHKDKNEILKSRSGAAFVTISDTILEHGGVVYGVGFKDHFRVAHKRATSKEERDEFRGSKYVQSDLSGVFRLVKEDLKRGFTVLFSGTPCQTAGLNSYIGEKLRVKLFLLDIVCHGVPSPFIWRDYVDYLEMKYDEELIAVNFRDKGSHGWAAHKESYFFKTKRVEKVTFTNLFYQGVMLRQSCGKCHFANLQRPSDITLADFWGWEKNVPHMNHDDKGISLVLLNTEKGKELFEEANRQLDICKVNLNNSLQPNLQHPSSIPSDRVLFEKEYAEKGGVYIFNKYDKGRKNFIKQNVKKFISVIDRFFLLKSRLWN